MARKYAHIWERLKTEQHLSITSPASSHKTILRALRAESARDTVFRFKCVEKGKAYRIGFNSIGDLLVVRLEWKDKIPVNFMMHRSK